ncbi:MAG: hypothetical protein AAB524_00395 [Patescibacteria group bacterium]
MLKATCGCGYSSVANTEEEMMIKMKEHLANSPDCAKKVEGKSEEEQKEMLRQITEEV